VKINYDESGKILSAGIGDDFQGIEYIQPLPIDFEHAFSLGKYQINLDTLLVEKLEGWIAPDGYVPFVREIDARQLRLALLQMELLDDIEAALSQLGRAAQIEWEYATNIREDYPLVLALATNLGLDTKEIFDLANSFN
jgi:hypothetical protein